MDVMPNVAELRDTLRFALVSALMDTTTKQTANKDRTNGHAGRNIGGC